MSSLINVPLIINPLNWITVFLMVTVALFAADTLQSALTGGASATRTL